MKPQHSPEGYAEIHLATDEYGNELMLQVAEAYFSEQPSCQFVRVYEHGGWYLGYRRDGSIWTTANDMAHIPEGTFPKYYERCIRRGSDTDYWLMNGKVIPARQRVA